MSELRVSVGIELQKSINRLARIALVPAGPMRLTGNKSRIRLLESLNAHLSAEEPWRRPRPPGEGWGLGMGGGGVWVFFLFSPISVPLFVLRGQVNEAVACRSTRSAPGPAS